MYKFFSILILCMFLTISLKATPEDTPSGWADINEFCDIQDIDKDICYTLIYEYQEATRSHFRSMSVDVLRKISRRIDELADVGSEQIKKMREAVDNLGDTLRNPIEIPFGVRGLESPQQEYIIE